MCQDDQSMAADAWCGMNEMRMLWTRHLFHFPQSSYSLAGMTIICLRAGLWDSAGRKKKHGGDGGDDSDRTMATTKTTAAMFSRLSISLPSINIDNTCSRRLSAAGFAHWRPLLIRIHQDQTTLWTCP